MNRFAALLCGLLLAFSTTACDSFSDEFIGHYDSPHDFYSLNAYVRNGGATTAYAIVVKRVDNRNGGEKLIYTEYRQETVEILWEDEDTVRINGHPVDLLGGVVHVRN